MMSYLKPGVGKTGRSLCRTLSGTRFALMALAGLMSLWGQEGRGAVPANGSAKPAWEEVIRRIAPQAAPAEPKQERTVLVFSLSTGYYHTVLPRTEAVVRILGEVSGAYNVVCSNDIEQFLPGSLGRYDAVVLNNNCPDGKERDVFRDVLVNKVETYGERYAHLPLAEREALAKKLYTSLVDYVAGGGGLAVLHGAIANFNYSDAFSALAGGSFDRHPPEQEVILRPVEPGHPLLEPFGGRPFVHHDEPYLFNRAYARMNFRPLLEIDTSNMEHLEEIETIRGMKRYAAWIKRHQQGRVFYCSPSHTPESFEQPALLQFILGGIQYALGDLACPDTPPDADRREGP